jgi:predicted esterase
MAGRWVLCLHGAEQDGEIFRGRLERFAKKCAAKGIKLAFVDAPFSLPLKAGQDVAMRCWFPRDPDGVPYTESVAAAVATVEKTWREHAHPFTGLVAFSQGASVVYEILKTPERVPGCRAVIVAGGAADPRAHLTSLAPLETPPSLHATGTADALVPSAKSRALAELFGPRAELLEHGQGHCFPGRAVDLDRCVGFLAAHTAEGSTSTALPRVLEAPDEAHAAQQNDELESLESIYDADLQVYSRSPVRIAVTVPLPDVPGGDYSGGFTIEMAMPNT